MTSRQRTKHTQLFLVRFWSQDEDLVPEGQSECRGKVQRTVDGEARQFQDWGGLVSTLQAMLAGTPPDAGAPCTAQARPSEDPDTRGKRK